MNIHDDGRSGGVAVGTTTRTAPSFMERAILSVLVLTVVFGLAVDTRSHRESAQIDSFFTRSHALAYAASSACAVFLLYLVRKRQTAGHKRLAAIPLGLESAIAGLGVYVLGGIGDMWWHTTYGVEQELKILFSPTHLLLMCAMLMLAFGPIRSAWMADDNADAENAAGDNSQLSRWTGLSRMWPVALAAGCITAVLNIFFTYSSPFETAVFTTKVPPLFGQFAQFLFTASTMAVFTHTVVFFGVMMLVMRRWELPLGTFLLAFAVPAGSMFVYFDWSYNRRITALLVGAVVCEIVNLALALIRSSWFTARTQFRVFAAITPPLFWSAYLLVTKNGDPISWSREQWTGTIIWTGIIGLGLSVLFLPPRLNHPTYLD
jgi:hypothetical protein